MNDKNILVLVRNDSNEAMRVAAGLTISGHSVRLVFMKNELSKMGISAENTELLELSDISPETTVLELSSFAEFLDRKEFVATLDESDLVLSI